MTSQAIRRLDESMVFAMLRQPDLLASFPEFSGVVASLGQVTNPPKGTCACTTRTRRGNLASQTIALIQALPPARQLELKPLLGVTKDTLLKTFKKGPKGLVTLVF